MLEVACLSEEEMLYNTTSIHPLCCLHHCISLSALVLLQASYVTRYHIWAPRFATTTWYTDRRYREPRLSFRTKQRLRLRWKLSLAGKKVGYDSRKKRRKAKNFRWFQHSKAKTWHTLTAVSAFSESTIKRKVLREMPVFLYQWKFHHLDPNEGNRLYNLHEGSPTASTTPGIAFPV